MKLRLSKPAVRDLHTIGVHRGENYIRDKVEEVLYMEKKKLHQEFREQYIKNRMTGREFYALTGMQPTREMHRKRLEQNDIQHPEYYYLQILSENGDYFGYADDYFREVILEVEQKAS
ncbi:MAG: hypothetical protein ACQESG_06465 [Nanobdellota archaeon]